MTDTRDAAAAFDKVAADLEPLLIRLGRASPGAEPEIVRDEITAALDAVGLRWSDLAARVSAPSPAKPQPARVPPPEFRMVPPTRQAIDPKTVMMKQELDAYGYRQRGLGLGYEGTDVSGVDELQGDGTKVSGEG